MGDLVFNHRQPYIDGPAGASVENWMTILQTVHGRFSDDTVFVFGHAGDGWPVVGTRADLITMKDFLDALYGATRARLADGQSAAQMEGFEVPGHAEWGPTPMRVIEPVVAEIERSR